MPEIIDAEYTEIPADENPGADFMSDAGAPPPPTTPPQEDTPSKLDKVADFIGAYAAAFILTFLAACGIAFFLSSFPAMKFNFPLVLKTWGLIWSLMLVKGALKNKTL